MNHQLDFKGYYHRRFRYISSTQSLMERLLLPSAHVLYILLANMTRVTYKKNEKKNLTEVILLSFHFSFLSRQQTLTSAPTSHIESELKTWILR